MRAESFEKLNGTNHDNKSVKLRINTSIELKIPCNNESLNYPITACYESNNLHNDERNKQTDIKSINDEQLDVSEDTSSEINYLNKLRQSDIKTEVEKHEIKKNLADHFAREAQKISRNKDLYLKLVNTAIYGNFNYKYYENQTNYNKAAEYFALYGFGDSLDSTFQFDSCNNKVKAKTEDEKSNGSNKLKNFVNPTSTLAEQVIINESKLTFGNPLQSIPPQMSHSNTVFPKAINLLTSQQQVLMHLNQPTNILSNYPATTLIQYGATPFWLTNAIPYFNAASAAAAAYFNETHINTSIIQQQQQLNFFGGAGPYDMQYLGIYYAQILQRSQQITQTISANNRLFEQHQTRTIAAAAAINSPVQYESTSSKQINNISSSGNQQN